MASRIQIARGLLSAKNKDNLLEGELFWQSSNATSNKENNYREYTNAAWDEGTLYIGKPSLNDNAYDDPIPIAGYRSFKALVKKQNLNKNIKSIEDDIFKYVREGDFFIFSEDPESGTFKEIDDFRKNDILLITNATVNIDTGEAENGSIQYTKIDCSGGDAYQTRFDNSHNNFNATSVQSAIEELDYEKLSYRGTLELQSQVNSLKPDNGTIYLLESNNLVFSNQAKYPFSRATKKGDFVVYLNDTDGWRLIPSGKDAYDIDYDTSNAVSQQEDIGTFSEGHILKTTNINNIGDILDFLLSNKAQLDASGKIPLSQLHDTVLGAMQYCGKWNPLINDDTSGVNDPAKQSSWPIGMDNDNSSEDGLPIANHNGDYYIVQTSGKNIQYADKDSLQSDGTYSRYIELNAGDWIVWSKSPISDESVVDSGNYHWAKIDNTDRITALNFVINAKISNSNIVGVDQYTTTKIGTPTFTSSNKIALVDDNGTINIAGINLISHKENEKSKSNTLLRFADNNNTIENTDIYSYNNEEKGNVTLFYTNLSVGDLAHTYESEVHGDILVFPHLSLEEDGLQDTQIRFFSANDTSLSTTFRELDLRIDNNQINGSIVILPNESSKIIGKLAGVNLISGRITKSTTNGYIESSSIEEHMTLSENHKAENGTQTYNDSDISVVEIHAPVLTVNNAEVRHIVFGQKENIDDTISNGGLLSDNGHLLDSEHKTNIYANESLSEDIEVTLPNRSSVLINKLDLDERLSIVSVDKNTLPILKEQVNSNNEKYLKLLNSNISQKENILQDILSSSASVKTDDDKNYIDTYNKDVENEIISETTILGHISKTDNRYYISENKNLYISGNTIIGNTKSNNTFIHSEKYFLEDTQYKTPFSETIKPIKEIHLDLPTSSGVLLSSTSRIDGGEW